MDIIEDFIGRYRREYDFYDQGARLVALQLEARLQAAGVRAMVTFRAKAVAKLEPKVRDRAARKAYPSVEHIYADIPDLAGTRVALYFPGQSQQVSQIINDLFVVTHTKTFPDSDSSPKYKKRFAGYSATHYRVRLRETALVDSQKRYAEARVEIQVASVLMHAWSEVEHDLVYKPYQGRLSEDEYAILDELNGLVMAGEIALERLQRAGAARIAAQGRKFANHYELAAHLLSVLGELADANRLQSGLGRVDLLFELLLRAGFPTPEAVGQYLESIHADLERRPIAEQIVDQVLSEDPERYKLFEEIRAARPASEVSPDAAEPIAPDLHEAMGQFLMAWTEMELTIRQKARAKDPYSSRVIPVARLLDSYTNLDKESKLQFDRLRRIRNNLVHGIEVPAPIDLREAAQQVRGLLARIRA